MMSRIDGSIVMVAGGAGFVGSALVRRLLQRNIQVVCFDNYLHGDPQNVAGLGDRLQLVHGDVLDPICLVLTMQRYKVQFVFNCVGDTFVPTAYWTPTRFFDINLRGNLNVLQAANASGVKRVLYVSSTEVYGGDCTKPIAEDVPLAPVNTYAVSKLAADQLCLTFHIEHHIPVITARIFNCFGPRESQPYIIPEIIYQLHRGNRLRLGNIDAQRDFTFVDDTAEGLIAVMESDIDNGEAVNVGSGKAYRVRDIVMQIAELMGVSSVEIEIDPARLRCRDINLFVCDNTKLRTRTGWEPQVSFRDGLVKTIEWFRQNGSRWSWENFVDGAKTYR